MEGRRKQVLTILKILVSALLLYFIFTRLPFKAVREVLREANFAYLILALLFFMLSKTVSAFRLNLFFHQLNARLTQRSNLKLYLLGMFYNLFLPGGIGGDAYKGFRIEKEFKTGTKRVVAALLFDRLSGLLVLFLLACGLGYFIAPSPWAGLNWLLPTAGILSLVLYWRINTSYFTLLYPVFWRAIFYSLGVQLLQLLSVWFILKSFEVETQYIAYLFVFLVSSIVAVVPVTIGGIGSREVVFLYGALWLGLQEDTSVTVSLIFFALTALVSLVGSWFHVKKLSLETIDPQGT